MKTANDLVCEGDFKQSEIRRRTQAARAVITAEVRGVVGVRHISKDQRKGT